MKHLIALGTLLSLGSCGTAHHVVLFSADWCGACKTVEHKLIELNVDFSTVDVDQDPRAVETHNIRGIPTIVLIDDTRSHQLIGDQPKTTIHKFLRRAP